MKRTLPGFRLTLGVTLIYLGVLLVIPLAVCVLKAAQLGPAAFWAAVWTPRARSAYLLTFGASFAAAAVTSLLGFLIAWVLVRYEWPMKRLVDSLVDLPLALPTAVAGLTYSMLYVKNGWFGQFLVPLGIYGTYSRLGIVLVLSFIGLPFAVRAVQPVLESLEVDAEEAAILLGANRWQTFWRVILPTLMPAIITGFALSFARAIGEYGSVVFISSNIPGKTEIAPMLIATKLEENSYAEATAIALVLLVMSFGMLAVINVLERRSRRYYV
ncbi:MAG TPA: sulfate ABC transporter permease subunit CysT [Pirellulales bacterium]|jgi:sulfate transport system permease protein